MLSWFGSFFILLEKKAAAYAALLVAIVTLFFGAVGRFFDLAHGRLGMVDTLTSDILSIGRIFVVADIVGYFVEMYRQIIDAKTTDESHHKQPERGTAPPVPHGFAGAAREENYFSVFEASITKLGSLRASVVANVTAFYTFLKAARDATKAIKNWEDKDYKPEMKCRDVVDVIYLCLLSAIHGRDALKGLCIDEYVRRYFENAFHLIEAKAFHFLNNKLSDKDFRRHYIERRRSYYSRLINEITEVRGDESWLLFRWPRDAGPA